MNNKLFFCFLLLISFGISYFDYFVNVENIKNESSYYILKNFYFDYFINLQQTSKMNNTTQYYLNNLSYDYFINLIRSTKKNETNYNLTLSKYDYFVNLMKKEKITYYNYNGFPYDYFVLLNITGALNITNISKSIVLISPKNNTYTNNTNVHFNYLVYNYTGSCYAILDGVILNISTISIFGNVSFNASVSSGEHYWYVVCSNLISNISYFYVVKPEIIVYSPKPSMPEGDILFYIKILSYGNVSSKYELYDSKGNMLINGSFGKILYNYATLNTGKYTLKIISSNNYSFSVKTINFSLFKFTGSNLGTVPENPMYVLIVFIMMLIYMIKNKNKKLGD